MDSWGEMEMVGTIMDRDVEMVPCETLDLTVPAEAEIVVEGRVKLNGRFRVGDVTSPSMYHLPHYEELPEVEITAITMRADRPIYRNHQTTPATDHQPLPRLCHEAVLYNRLTENGLNVKDVRFRPGRRAPASCSSITRARFRQRRADDRDGRAWLNTKMVVAVSPDTDLTIRATSITPSRRAAIRRATSSSSATPAARPTIPPPIRSKASTPGGWSARSASMRR
jgi:2,5-furandicarboxylate decarboxylase 1